MKTPLVVVLAATLLAGAGGLSANPGPATPTAASGTASAVTAVAPDSGSVSPASAPIPPSNVAASPTAAPLAKPMADPKVGQPETAVYAALGQPMGRVDMPNSVILMYDRGDVTVRNGVVAEVNLLAPEVYAKKTAREAAEKIEHEADNAETQAMRKSLLSDPNYLSLSTRDRIIALKEFEREHPDADVEADLEALLAVYDTELSQENNLAQLEQQLAQAQQQAEAAEQAAASAQQAAATAEQAAAAAEQQAAQQTATGAPSTSSTVLVVGSGYGPPRITPYASLYQINSQFIGSYRPPNGSVTVTQNGSGSHGSGSTSPPPTLNAGPSPLTPARPAPAAPGVIPRVGLVPVSGNG